jgi:hypothetical protein
LWIKLELEENILRYGESVHQEIGPELTSVIYNLFNCEYNTVITAKSFVFIIFIVLSFITLNFSSLRRFSPKCI